MTGRITLDGNPIESTDIVFQPDGSRPPSYGRTDKNGNYELGYKRGVMGALVGQHTVRISTSPELVRGPNRYPAQYNTESTLRKEVKPEKNRFDFDLTSEAK